MVTPPENCKINSPCKSSITLTISLLGDAKQSLFNYPNKNKQKTARYQREI